MKKDGTHYRAHLLAFLSLYPLSPAKMQQVRKELDQRAAPPGPTAEAAPSSLDVAKRRFGPRAKPGMTQPAEVTYRKVLTEDMDFLRQLRRQTMYEVVTRHHPWIEEVQEHRLRTDLDSALIVRLGSEDIGMFKVARREDHIELMQIQIVPKLQGLGIGTRIVQGLQAEAGKAGLPLVLNSYATNSALDLFRRLGFEEAASTKHFRGLRWTG